MISKPSYQESHRVEHCSVIKTIVNVLLPCLALTCSASNLWAADQGSGAAPQESAYSALQWRGIGPFRGGRAVAVAGVPGSPKGERTGS